jgi:hypothetical protein
MNKYDKHAVSVKVFMMVKMHLFLYQQPNFDDPTVAGAFTGPYGYIPAGF